MFVATKINLFSEENSITKCNSRFSNNLQMQKLTLSKLSLVMTKHFIEQADWCAENSEKVNRA